MLERAHNWPLQEFSQGNNQASHTTYVVYVLRDLELNVDSESQILKKLSLEILFAFKEVFVTRLLSGRCRKKYFRSYFISFSRDVRI